MQYIQVSTICGSWIVCEFSPTLAPTSPSSSSQDSVFDVNRYTENPVQERSGRTSEEQRRNPLHKPTETENKNKSEEREELQRKISHELLDWLQEFGENLVDESTSTEPWENPDQGSQSHLMNNQVRVSIVSTRTFRRTQIAISA